MTHIALVVVLEFWGSLKLEGYESLQYGEIEEVQKATPVLGAAGLTCQWDDFISIVTALVKFDQSEGCVGAKPDSRQWAELTGRAALRPESSAAEGGRALPQQP